MRAQTLLTFAMVTLFGLVNSTPVDSRNVQAAQAAHHAAIIASKEAADAKMFPGLNIHTFTWTFDVHPGIGNDTASFKGTVEHAMAQMEETYPGWRKEYDEHLAKNPIEERGLDDPDSYWDKRYDCGDGLVRGWYLVPTGDIRQGAEYLRRQKGPVHMPMYFCGRVSCSYHAAIFLCNRDPLEMILKDWTRVADGARFISEACMLHDNDVPWDWCRGSAEHDCDARPLLPGQDRIGCPHESWAVQVRGLHYPYDNPAEC